MSIGAKQRKSAFTLTPTNGQKRWIGFDLDMTIIRYKLQNLSKHIFDGTAMYLVTQLGYPDWVLELNHDVSTLLRGVILDKVHGNILTIDRDKRVHIDATSKIAYHGTRQLTADEIAELYSSPTDFVGYHDFRYWPSSSHFETPYISMLSQLIDCIDSGKLSISKINRARRTDQATAPSLKPVSNQSCNEFISNLTSERKEELYAAANSPYYKLVEDLHDAIFYNYSNFESGYYFPPFRDDRIADFVYDRTDLIPLLKSLKTEKQKIILLTNSNHHYTKALLNCAFKGEEHWRPLFDLIVYRSKKPQIFFVPETPFMLLEKPHLPGEVNGLRPLQQNEKVELGNEYYGGNLDQLKRDLIGDDEVIYVGDDLFGDIVAPSCFAGWTTIAVVEELQELEILNGFEIDRSHAAKEMKRLEKTAAQLDVQGWGNYFYTSNGHLSYWGFLMHYFSDVAVPCVQRLDHFSLDSTLLPHHPDSQDSNSDNNFKLHPTTSLLNTNNHKISPMFVLPDLKQYQEIQKTTDAVRYMAHQLIAPSAIRRSNVVQN